MISFTFRNRSILLPYQFLNKFFLSEKNFSMLQINKYRVTKRFYDITESLNTSLKIAPKIQFEKKTV